MLKVRCLVLSLFLGALAGPDLAQAEEVAVGIAAVDITPPRGYRMAGYFNERTNTGTKDPLFAKAIVFRQEDRRAALIFCDLIAMPQEISSNARSLIAERCKIPVENVAICATHSHTGPLFYGVLRKHFHERAIEKNGKDVLEEVDYPAKLVESLVEAVVKAQAALAPTKLAAGIAQEDRLAFNRRFHLKDGRVVFNPGLLNPNIAKVAGPIDPDVGLISFAEPDGKTPKGILTVYALHLDTVSGTEYSADYPHFLDEAIKKALGPDVQSLFGTGTCGDINHIDVKTTTVRKAAEIGGELARTVLAKLPSLEPIAAPSLDVARAVVEVPTQTVKADEVAKSRSQLDLVGDPKLAFLDAVRTVTVVDLADNYPKGTVPLEVQAFRLSPDVAIVTLPGEVFVEIGMAIKKASPFKTTLVIELANDIPSYVPTKKAFSEGSYEIVNSRVLPGGGEAMADAAIGLLKKLAR
ncbi:neutral/alkaline non-lysosomal ceramidase N-terminal domain-containing protein [Singulisphaera sp. PoT]|uniref:neutral/alkaline non-lysosomal ceramidase N-terminal domain-containing protein n=1 Tax=Singulisphaera sp. PoT TaxID=3411797 RepID=UPI003BF580E7